MDTKGGVVLPPESPKKAVPSTENARRVSRLVWKHLGDLGPIGYS